MEIKIPRPKMMESGKGLRKIGMENINSGHSGENTGGDAYGKFFVGVL